ncbi:MAG: hypothetical protein J6K58_04735 [Lachnospiraceae bacterium]|nr:hypothetical protein [Lachnospiraceae bacterium]
MKVTVLGISRREVERKDGRKAVYTSIFYTEPFDEYTRSNQVCFGEKCGSVNTALDTETIHVGDEISLDYAPTGFTSQDGKPEFRLQSIDLINPFKGDKK